MRNTAFALAMAQSYLRWLMQWLASDRLSVITLSSPAAWLAGAAGGAALTGLAGFSTTGQALALALALVQARGRAQGFQPVRAPGRMPLAARQARPPCRHRTQGR